MDYEKLEGKFPQRFNERYALSLTSVYDMLISGYFSVPKFEVECKAEADTPGDLVCPFGQ